jgi:hypothetical protein
MRLEICDYPFQKLSRISSRLRRGKRRECGKQEDDDKTATSRVILVTHDGGDDTRMVLGVPHNQMAFALQPGRTK